VDGARHSPLRAFMVELAEADDSAMRGILEGVARDRTRPCHPWPAVRARWLRRTGRPSTIRAPASRSSGDPRRPGW
jgi:hypothetical protein